MPDAYTPKYPLDTPVTVTITYDDYCTIRAVLFDRMRASDHSGSQRLLIDLMGKLSYLVTSQLSEVVT